MEHRSDRVTRWEENLIAIFMAVLVVTAFSQVVARYVFNSGWTGALEFQRIVFAWLILFGMAYGVKTGIHLGVDALIRGLPRPLFRTFALFGAFCVLLYAIILLHSDWLTLFGANTRGGAVDYWVRFYRRPIGLEDIRYPEWARELFGLQERVPRWIAYLILPFGLGLLALRSIQALVAIARGRRELIIASHEAEELVAEHKDALKDDADGEGPIGQSPGAPSL